MIRGKVERHDGGEEWFFGLSMMNVTLLMQGKPIRFDASELGAPAGTSIVIFFGQTEESMVEDLKKAGIEMPAVEDRRGGIDHE